MNHITKDKISKEGISVIKTIATLEDSAIVRFVAMISKSTIQPKKVEGEFYLSIALADKTGVIDMPIWDNAEILAKELPIGTVVYITGVKKSFENRPQITMKTIQIVDDIESSAFMPKYKTETAILIQRILEYACKIKDKRYTKMLEEILGIKIINKNYYEVKNQEKWDAYTTCPAASRMHGNKIFGLLMHTVGVLQIIDNMVTSYERYDGVEVKPEDAINADLMYFMGIIHDFCKIYEYTYDLAISRKENLLVSHDIFLIGELYHVNKQLGNLFSDEEMSKMFLIELIHHGEHGNYKPYEKTEIPVEAKLLHNADMIDSQIVGNIEKIKIPSKV